MTMRRFLSFALAAACAISLPAIGKTARADKGDKAAKAEKPTAESGDGIRHGVMVFSDLCTDAGGNIQGQRITWMRYAEGDMVMFEYADGTLGWPRFSARTLLDEKTRTLRFIAQGDSTAPRVVTAQVSSSGNSVAVDGDAAGPFPAPRRLMMVKDFSKPWPACAP